LGEDEVAFELDESEVDRRFEDNKTQLYNEK
jgi:hypothetical protein